MKIKKAIDICKKTKMIGTFYVEAEQALKERGNNA